MNFFIANNNGGGTPTESEFNFANPTGIDADQRPVYDSENEFVFQIDTRLGNVQRTWDETEFLNRFGESPYYHYIKNNNLSLEKPRISLMGISQCVRFYDREKAPINNDHFEFSNPDGGMYDKYATIDMGDGNVYRLEQTWYIDSEGTYRLNDREYTNLTTGEVYAEGEAWTVGEDYAHFYEMPGIYNIKINFSNPDPNKKRNVNFSSGTFGFGIITKYWNMGINNRWQLSYWYNTPWTTQANADFSHLADIPDLSFNAGVITAVAYNQSYSVPSTRWAGHIYEAAYPEINPLNGKHVIYPHGFSGQMLFSNCKSLTHIPNFEQWDMSNCRLFNMMFEGCELFDQDINDWAVGSEDPTKYNTIQAHGMYGGFAWMFEGCSNFNSPLDKWELKHINFTEEYGVPNGSNHLLVQKPRAHNMFQGCMSFNQDISHFPFERLGPLRDFMSPMSLSSSYLNEWQDNGYSTNGLNISDGDQNHSNKHSNGNYYYKDQPNNGKYVWWPRLDNSNYRKLLKKLSDLVDAGTIATATTDYVGAGFGDCSIQSNDTEALAWRNNINTHLKIADGNVTEAQDTPGIIQADRNEYPATLTQSVLDGGNEDNSIPEALKDHEAFVFKIDTSLGNGQNSISLYFTETNWTLNGKGVWGIDTGYSYGHYSSFFRIDWGDGNIIEYDSPTQVNHTYNNGLTTHIIKIEYDYMALNMSANTIIGNNEKITEIIQWGYFKEKDKRQVNKHKKIAKEKGENLRTISGGVDPWYYDFPMTTTHPGAINDWNDFIGYMYDNIPEATKGSWIYAHGAFEGCSNLSVIRNSYITEENGKRSQIKNVPYFLIDSYKREFENQSTYEHKGISFANLFKNCSSLTTHNFEQWDVSLGSDFQGMFEGCTLLNDQFYTWDVSNCFFDDKGAGYSRMFKNCTSLRGNGDMFAYWNINTTCYSKDENGEDVVDTLWACRVDSMFEGCRSLGTSWSTDKGCVKIDMVPINNNPLELGISGYSRGTAGLHMWNLNGVRYADKMIGNMIYFDTSYGSNQSRPLPIDIEVLLMSWIDSIKKPLFGDAKFSVLDDNGPFGYLQEIWGKMYNPTNKRFKVAYMPRDCWFRYSALGWNVEFERSHEYSWIDGPWEWPSGGFDQNTDNWDYYENSMAMFNTGMTGVVFTVKVGDPNFGDGDLTFGFTEEPIRRNSVEFLAPAINNDLTIPQSGRLTTYVDNSFKISSDWFDNSLIIDWGEKALSENVPGTNCEYINETAKEWSSKTNKAYTHTYSQPGEYIVRILGKKGYFDFNKYAPVGKDWSGKINKIASFEGAFGMIDYKIHFKEGFKNCNNAVLDVVNTEGEYGSRTWYSERTPGETILPTADASDGIGCAYIDRRIVFNQYEHNVNLHIKPNRIGFNLDSMFEGCSKLCSNPSYGSFISTIFESQWGSTDSLPGSYNIIPSALTSHDIYNTSIFQENGYDNSYNRHFIQGAAFIRSAKNLFKGTDISNITALKLWMLLGQEGNEAPIEGMFENCTNFNPNIDDWIFPKYTLLDSVGIDMLGGFSELEKYYPSVKNLFKGCSSFDRAIDGSKFASQSTDFTGFLNGVTLSTSNYNQTLISFNDNLWPPINTVDKNSIDFGNSKYSLNSEASNARASLISKGWNIIDGGGE